MRFRTQLVVGVGALLVLALSSGVLVVVTLVVSTRRANELTGHVVDDLSRLHEVRVHAEQLVTAARGYLLTGDEPFRKKLEVREQEFERALTSLRGHSHWSRLQTQLSIVEERFVEYTRATVRAARARQLRGDLAALEEAFEVQLQPQRRALDRAVIRLVELERERVAEEATESGRLVHQFGVALFIAWLIGMAITVTLAVLVVRRLNGQYNASKDAEQRATEAADSRKQIVEIVAHDLLSPLSAIALGLEVMKMQATPAPKADAMARAVERMRHLVNDLVDVARAEQSGFLLERKHHGVAELLHTTAELFRDSADRRRVSVRVDAAPELQAFVDRDRVIQVLTNLVSNAVRVAREGEEIVLAATKQDDGSVRFSVTDAGPGIPTGEVDHLFDAYRQGSEGKRKGSLGLGLYICRSLVEAHGGTIGVDSSPGKGSTFWFDIPAPRTHNAEQTAASAVYG